MSVFRILAMLVPFLFIPEVVSGGVVTCDGTEERVWEACAVVLARVVAPPPDLEPVRFSIEVTGVVVTDTYLPTRLDDLAYGGRNSALFKFRPARGEVYALRLIKREGRWRMDDSYLTFFESGCGAERVAGPDDPKFLRLVGRIAKVRAESLAKSPPRPPEPPGAP